MSADKAGVEESKRTADVAETGRRAELRAADFQSTRPARGSCRQAEDLHICPACSSQLVHPVDWSPVAGRRWLVELRCPDCEWTGGGRYPQRVVDRYDEVLDDGTEALLEDLNHLTRANMEEHVEAFVAALHGDAILPEDF